jgi:hypothetical protein
MGFRFKLQVPLPRIRTEIILKRTFDVRGMGVMPLNEIAVVAVHGAHQIGQGSNYAMWQAALEGRGIQTKPGTVEAIKISGVSIKTLL